MTSDTQKNFSRDALFDLTGRVALITGGGSGIGLMATQALAVNGAKVYICGRTKEKLDTVVEKYGQNIAGEIIPIQADINTKEGIKALVADISSREKCLCILINNAGISSESFAVTENENAEDMKKSLFDAEKATFDDWTEIYRTNVASVYFLTAALLPLVQKSTERHEGWSGTILNISSISGFVKTSQHHFSYNASKGAAVHLTRMLASDVAAAGIKVRINAVAPGVFPSEMTAQESDENQKSHIPAEKYESKVPAGRPGHERDMASAILFTVVNQYLNGQNIIVDGGYTIAAGE